MTELDQHLLRYRSTGDPEALGALFDAAAPGLLRIARRLTPDAASADDALQETFLTVTEKAQDWDPTRPAGPWLVGVLSHRAQTVRRKAARRVEQDRVADRTVPEPWESAQSQDLDLVVREAVKGLPPAERAVVTASLFEGLNGVQLAERFGLQAGTARVRLHRGLERLRGALPLRTALSIFGFGASSARLAAIRGRLLDSAGGATAVASSKGSLGVLGLALAAAAILVWRGVLPLFKADPGASETAVTMANLEDSVDEVAAVPPAEGRVALTTTPSEEAPKPTNAVQVHVVYAADGLPAVGVVVEAGWSAGGEWTLQEAITDAGGHASLPYRDGAAPRRIQALPTDKTGLAQRFLNRLTPDELESQLELVVAQGGTFEGRVVDSGGRPVPGAEVRGWCGSPRPGPADRVVIAGADGRFRMEYLGPTFEIGATKEGLALVSGFKGKLAPKERVEGLEIVLASAHQLKGQVVDMEGNELEGVKVWTEPERNVMSNRLRTRYSEVTILRGDARETRTDRNGRFEVPGATSPRARLHFEMAPFMRKYEDVDVPGTELRVALDQGLSLEGTVLDPAGRPAEGATVAFGPYYGNVHTGPRSVETDQFGHFRVRGFGLPGTWGGSDDPYLIITKEGYAIRVEQPVTPTRGATGPAIQIRMEQERLIEGTVLDPEGRPLQGTSVWVEGEREMDLGAEFSKRPTWEFKADLDEATTDLQGTFRLKKLYAGMYTLHVVDPADPLRDVTFQVQAGSEPTTYVFDPRAADKVVITGTVRDAQTGDPVQRFTICPFIGSRGMNREIESPGGDFRVSGLPEGDIKVQVTADGYARRILPKSSFEFGEHVLELELHRTAPFSFRVVDETGEARERCGLLAETLDGEELSFEEGSGSWSGTLVTPDTGRDVAQGLPMTQLRFTVESDSDTAEFTVDLSVPQVTEYEFVLPRTPPIAPGALTVALFVLPNLSASEVERRLEQYVASGDQQGAIALIDGPEILFPERKIELVMSRRGGDQRATLTLEPDPKGGFLFSQSQVTQSAREWRTGYSSSSGIPSKLSVPVMATGLPSGTWDVEVKSGETLIRAMVIEVSPSTADDVATPSLRVISI